MANGTGGTQTQQGAGNQSGDPGQGADQSQQSQQGDTSQQASQTHTGAAGAAQTGTAGSQPSGFKITLTDAQRAALLAGEPLVLSDEQYTGGVRQQMEQERRLRKAAEKQLAEIAKQREEEERKALTEQEKFKDLYEKEATAHKATAERRKGDAVRAAFAIAAAKAGVVDTDLAFLAAKALPLFEKVSVDDEGAVSGVDDVIQQLVKDKPFLVSQQQRQTVGAPSNPSTTEAPPPKTLAEAGDQLEARLKTGQV